MLALLLASCVKDDYRMALPTSPMALMFVDASSENSTGRQNLLQKIFDLSGDDDAGIDMKQRLYFFETADGNLGLCAALYNADKMVETITDLSGKGRCKVLDKAGDAFSTVIDSAWVLAFDDDAMLMMGPVLEADQKSMQNRVLRMVAQDEKHGGALSQMFQTLDTIHAPIALVAQIQAFPESVSMPFMLGVPQGVDPSEVVLKAGMRVQDKCLLMRGKTLSFNKAIDRQLNEVARVFHPIEGHYLNTMSADAFMGMFMNIDGMEFLPLMQNNKNIQAMLMGANMAVDMNKIIKSIHGDMAIVFPELASQADNFNMSMVAKLSDAHWITDLNYWKASCPRGATLSAWDMRGFHYQNGPSHFYFGVDFDSKPALEFMCGTTAQLARGALKKADNPISDVVQQHLSGAIMGMVVHLNGLQVEEGPLAMLLPFLQTVLGDVNTIAYKPTNKPSRR